MLDNLQKAHKWQIWQMTTISKIIETFFKNNLPWLTASIRSLTSKSAAACSSPCRTIFSISSWKRKWHQLYFVNISKSKIVRVQILLLVISQSFGPKYVALKHQHWNWQALVYLKKILSADIKNLWIKAIETGIILSIVDIKWLLCILKKIDKKKVATIGLHQAAVQICEKV